MQRYLLIFLLITISSSACKRPAPVTGMPCETQYVDIPRDTSYLSTPLVIPTQLIEDKLNQVITRQIRDDFENENKNASKEKLRLKITRLGNIKVDWKNNVATYQAPLLILIEREIVNKKVIALPKALAVKTQFSLRLVFETTLNIGEDWKLQPTTRFSSFEWLSDVKILGGLVDVKKMVERKLYAQMPQILTKVDETIRANVHLDRAIRRVWIKLQKPMIINRKEQLVWLKFNPIRFEMGPISTEKGNLLIPTRLSATTQTLLGENPAYTIDSVLPPLVLRKELPNNAYVYMLSEIPYQDINDLISRKLKDKEYEMSGHNFRITNAEVWGCGTELVLHLSVKGSVQGDIYLRGTPTYEQDSQRLVMQNFDFEVKTQELLVASADWLLHDTFKDKMKNLLSLPLVEKIDKIPEAIMAGIERGRAGKKMDFIIEQWDFRPQQIWVQPNELTALVIVNARTKVILEQIGR